MTETEQFFFDEEINLIKSLIENGVRLPEESLIKGHQFSHRGKLWEIKRCGFVKDSKGRDLAVKVYVTEVKRRQEREGLV
jgi:hypothetical protein